MTFLESNHTRPICFTHCHSNSKLLSINKGLCNCAVIASVWWEGHKLLCCFPEWDIFLQGLGLLWGRILWGRARWAPAMDLQAFLPGAVSQDSGSWPPEACCTAPAEHPSLPWYSLPPQSSPATSYRISVKLPSHENQKLHPISAF